MVHELPKVREQRRELVVPLLVGVRRVHHATHQAGGGQLTATDTEGAGLAGTWKESFMLKKNYTKKN